MKGTKMNGPSRRILLITRNLPPLVGGMESLLLRCVDALEAEYAVTVVGPKGCSAYLNDSVEVVELPSGLVGFVLLSPFYALWLAWLKNPCLVFGGSGLTALACAAARKLSKAPTVCYVHGLDVVAENWIYQNLFVRCLRSFEGIIVNSKNTLRLCVHAGIAEQKTTLVHPGCELPIEVDRVRARNECIDELTGIDGFILLFVGRIARRKGLLPFIQNVFPELLRRRPETILVIAGDSPEESLSHRSDELHQIFNEIKVRGWEQKIKFLGKVDDATLAVCYAAADCLILPLVPVAGDVEGFGMVAIEAAAYGTPTVAFSEGGVSDAVAHGVSGYLVESGNYAAMLEVLTTLRAENLPAMACREHAGRFGWTVFNENFVSAVNQIIQGRSSDAA